MAPSILTQYDPNLPTLENNAAVANTTAGQYTSAASLLPVKLKQAIQEKLDYNKDLISSQAQHQADYFSAPATARAQYSDIVNPFDREKLVSQAVNNASVPYNTDSAILAERLGRISDLVTAGTGAFNSEASAAGTAAKNANDQLSSSLDLAKWLYGVNHQGGQSAVAANQARASLASDIAKGATFSDLYQRYSNYLPEYEIRNSYNSGPVAQKYGPAKETAPDEQKLLVGIPGGTKAVQSTVTPITSTSSGNTVTTGWKYKTSDGVTRTIYPAPKTGGLFGATGGLLGSGSKSATADIDPVQLITDAENAGIPESTVMSLLQSKGFIIQ